MERGAVSFSAAAHRRIPDISGVAPQLGRWHREGELVAGPFLPRRRGGTGKEEMGTWAVHEEPPRPWRCRVRAVTVQLCTPREGPRPCPLGNEPGNLSGNQGGACGVLLWRHRVAQRALGAVHPLLWSLWPCGLRWACWPGGCSGAVPFLLSVAGTLPPAEAGREDSLKGTKSGQNGRGQSLGLLKERRGLK